MERYHLSATEREVMEKLWKQAAPVYQANLLEEFRQEGKNWARQTLNTVLRRLEERGLVIRAKRMVWAACTQEQFGVRIALDAVNLYYDGKMQKFFSAFAEEAPISEEERQLLKEYILKGTRKEEK